MRIGKEHVLKIRTRIMLLYLGLSVLLIGISLPSLFYVISKTLNDSLESVISEAIKEVEENIVLSNGNIQVINTTEIEEKLLRNGEVFVKAEDDSGTVIYLGYGAEEAFEWSEHEKAWKRRSVTTTVENREVRITAVGNVYYNNTLDKVFTALLLLIPGYLAITAVFTYFMAKTMLKPISGIASAAKEIKNGNWEKRIEGVNTKDEIGELATEFNAMIHEIDESYSREKRFTSDASHELRTPLSIVGFCAEEALNSDDSEIIKENLETIQTESRKMSKIISELFVLSRGYEGRYQLHYEEIDLKETLDSVSDTFEDEIKKKNITIEDDVKENIILYADQGMYTQILMNVFGNAVKYSEKNGVIRFESYEDEKYIWLKVIDNGVGISEKDLPHIFDRFYRADTARDRDGSGLGLSIVKWMVEIHQGEVQAESEINKGTTIKIGIPKKPVYPKKEDCNAKG
ncbi:MAG: HAMP domain-containing histidine kinase [Lachnospiraceae bacterium]|nr:HAMP domain-containing histidine kinase [Lachnospiraceae bacterium]